MHVFLFLVWRSRFCEGSRMLVGKFVRLGIQHSSDDKFSHLFGGTRWKPIASQSRETQRNKSINQYFN